jgi:hypothetical protein
MAGYQPVDFYSAMAVGDVILFENVNKDLYESVDSQFLDLHGDLVSAHVPSVLLSELKNISWILRKRILGRKFPRCEIEYEKLVWTHVARVQKI